jgi:hypothetical protein
MNGDGHARYADRLLTDPSGWYRDPTTGLTLADPADSRGLDADSAEARTTQRSGPESLTGEDLESSGPTRGLGVCLANVNQCD